MRDSTRHEKVETAPGITSGGLFGPYKFVRLSSGRRLTFLDAMRDAESAHSAFIRGISRCFKLLATEWDLDSLERELDRMEEYVHAVRHAIAEKHEEKEQLEKIERLRNTAGRTPEEAAAYRAKADELERRIAR